MGWPSSLMSSAVRLLWAIKEHERCLVTAGLSTGQSTTHDAVTIATHLLVPTISPQMAVSGRSQPGSAEPAGDLRLAQGRPRFCRSGHECPASGGQGIRTPEDGLGTALAVSETAGKITRPHNGVHAEHSPQHRVSVPRAGQSRHVRCPMQHTLMAPFCVKRPSGAGF